MLEIVGLLLLLLLLWCSVRLKATRTIQQTMMRMKMSTLSPDGAVARQYLIRSLALQTPQLHHSAVSSHSSLSPAWTQTNFRLSRWFQQRRTHEHNKSPQPAESASTTHTIFKFNLLSLSAILRIYYNITVISTYVIMTKAGHICSNLPCSFSVTITSNHIHGRTAALFSTT